MDCAVFENLEVGLTGIGPERVSGRKRVVVCIRLARQATLAWRTRFPRCDRCGFILACVWMERNFLGAKHCQTPLNGAMGAEVKKGKGREPKPPDPDNPFDPFALLEPFAPFAQSKWRKERWRVLREQNQRVEKRKEPRITRIAFCYGDVECWRFCWGKPASQSGDKTLVAGSTAWFF